MLGAAKPRRRQRDDTHHENSDCSKLDDKIDHAFCRLGVGRRLGWRIGVAGRRGIDDQVALFVSRCLQVAVSS
jgi:hypothetical protein